MWGVEGPEAARRRAWGAEARSRTATRAGSHARAARGPRARREAERGVRAGALSAGESPRYPRSISNSGCFGNFPGAPPGECTEMRHAVKSHSRGFVCFQFVRWEKDEGCRSAPNPSLGDPPLEGPAPPGDRCCRVSSARQWSHRGQRNRLRWPPKELLRARDSFVPALKAVEPRTCT